jgi:hypothetical protein
MGYQELAYLFAGGVGLTAAGIIGSLWGMVYGRSPGLWLLESAHPAMPVNAMAVVFHAPMAFVKRGVWDLVARPIQGVALIAAGLGWSFLQGVFILTQFFGVK